MARSCASNSDSTIVAHSQAPGSKVCFGRPRSCSRDCFLALIASMSLPHKRSRWPHTFVIRTRRSHSVCVVIASCVCGILLPTPLSARSICQARPTRCGKSARPSLLSSCSILLTAPSRSMCWCMCQCRPPRALQRMVSSSRRAAAGLAASATWPSCGHELVMPARMRPISNCATWPSCIRGRCGAFGSCGMLRVRLCCKRRSSMAFVRLL